MLFPAASYSATGTAIERAIPRKSSRSMYLQRGDLMAYQVSFGYPTSVMKPTGIGGVRRPYRTTDSGKPRVHVVVRGFKDQGLVSLAEIVAAVKRLPDLHLTGLRSIAYDPKKRLVNRLRMQRQYLRHYHQDLHATRLGEYHTNLGAIFIFRFSGKRQLFNTIYHEIGHHVYYRIMDGVQRKIWVNELFPNSEHVTEYAGRNASEDFAESYAYYQCRPSWLRSVSEEKFVFMRDQIFGSLVATSGEAQRAEVPSVTDAPARAQAESAFRPAARGLSFQVYNARGTMQTYPGA